MGMPDCVVISARGSGMRLVDCATLVSSQRSLLLGDLRQRLRRVECALAGLPLAAWPLVAAFFFGVAFGARLLLDLSQLLLEHVVSAIVAA